MPSKAFKVIATIAGVGGLAILSYNSLFYVMPGYKVIKFKS